MKTDLLKKITIKNYYKISLLAVVLSCACTSLDEKPEGILAQETFFKTETDVNAALGAMYRSVNHSFHVNHGFFALHGSDDLSGVKSASFDALAPDSDEGNLLSRSWGYMYSGVYNANTIIANFDKADASDEFKTKAHAQARFWRGFLYLYLTNTFGTIPLTITPDATGEEGLTGFQEIYDLIIGDLKFAVDNLPATWPPTDIARPDKAAAQSFLALAYLYGAGFPLNNTAYPSLAASTAKAVKENSGHALLENFSDLWQGSASDGNNEAIFEYQFTDTNGDWGGAGGGTGNYIVGPSSSPSQMDDVNGWGELYSEITFFKEFPAGPRKDATFLTEFMAGGNLITWQESTEKHPFYEKYVSTVIDIDYDTNLFLMRYADVLLIHAEAQAIADGGTTTNADALDSYNKVRTRAGLSTATSITQTDVVNERAWELAGEFRRWFDIVRTETMDEEVVAKRDASERPISSSRTLTETSPWLPIPASEVQLNPNLKK